jgi:hypothetical protein
MDGVEIDLSKMAPWSSQPMPFFGPFWPITLIKKTMIYNGP